MVAQMAAYLEQMWVDQMVDLKADSSVVLMAAQSVEQLVVMKVEPMVE